ncbi:toxin-activating lysine-acyltransferase [Enterovibrio norvegicus]|uniref:toxin-activating lysine-acyltransferase n=1 Tax=Enterovibrio norvegicus TaxID=188144 RepID=UPI003553087B
MNEISIMRIGNEIPTMHAWNTIILGKTAREIGIDERMAILGRLTAFYARRNDKKVISVGSFYHWMTPAIKHEQVRVYYDEYESTPNGYIIWAWLSDKTLDEYLTNEKFVPHPSQWNEGANLVVFDICFSKDNKKNLKDVIRIKRSLTLSGVRSIHYREPANLGKQYSWYDYE